jgi:hypothetical protein
VLTVAALMERPPMSAPADCPANPFDRYGLRVVEQPAPREPNPPAVAEHSSALPALCRFERGLLAGLAALELAYLAGLAVFVRWALRRWIGA